MRSFPGSTRWGSWHRVAMTEGEKPIDRCTTQFLQLSLMAAKTSLACAHNLRIAVETGFAGSTSRCESFGFQHRAAETRYAGLRCVRRKQQRGSYWLSALLTAAAAGSRRSRQKKGHSINYRMSFIESGGDLPSRAVASQVLSAC